MARSQGPCPRVWLCATGSGAIHTSAYRVGETMSSIPDAYAAMEALGWRRRG